MLDRETGEVQESAPATIILTGFQFVPEQFNANGIVVRVFYLHVVDE